MDPVRNPYTPGAGRRPSLLAGRDEHVKAFEVAVRRFLAGRSDRSQMLTGLRGVGKTVLLQEFDRIATDHGAVYVHIEATDNLNFLHQIAVATRDILLTLSPGQRLRKQAQRALGVLKSFHISWNIPDSAQFTLGIDPVLGSADSNILQRDLTDLFCEVAEQARKQKSVIVIAIDEIQYVPKEHLAPLIISLHNVNKRDLPCIIVGAGLPSVLGLLGEARTYAERIFSFTSLDNLDRNAAIRALVDPAAQEEVMWDIGAVEEVVELTQGYPYFLQEFGKQTWHVAEGPDRITSDDLKRAVPLAISELDQGFFRVRVDRTTPNQRAYLLAMANMGPGPHRSGEVAEALQKKTTQVGPVRQSLIERGLCYSPRHDVIAFTVPMFDEYVKREIGSQL